MAIPRAIIDGTAYWAKGWKVESGQRLVAQWNEGWEGGMGETKRRSPNRYLHGEKIDSSSPGYLRLHPEILATISDADIDATLPVYTLEGLGPAPGSIAFGAVTTGNVTAASLTFSFTVSAGTDPILILGLSFDKGDSISYIAGTTVKYAGLSLTKLNHGRVTTGGISNDGHTVSLWYLVNPPIGTADIVVTLPTTASIAAGAVVATNVDQKTPFRATVATSGTSTAPSATTSSAVDDVVVDVLATGRSGALVTATDDVPDQLYNVALASGGSTAILGAGSKEAGAASVVSSWTLSASVAWTVITGSLRPAANLPMVYVLNGRYGYKLNGSSWSLMGTKDFGAGAQNGRAALFEGDWYISLGTTLDAQKLTAFGAGDETTDTFAAITGEKAQAFAAIQDGSTGKLARALNNDVDLSADGSDWSAANFEVGDDSFDITDMVTVAGELLVFRPDGVYRFTAGGASFPVTGFFPKDAGADVTLGSNSHGHGPYGYWPDRSGLWRIFGDNAVPFGPDADPEPSMAGAPQSGFASFGAVGIEGIEYPLQRGEWRSVTGVGRWLYGTHYSASFGAVDGDLLYGAIGRDGLVEHWHGSLYDSDRPLRVQRLARPALVIVDGTPGDSTTPAIKIMALEADGSPKTAPDSSRGATPASGETIEHFAIMAPLDWSDQGLADRQKQITRISFITEGMVTGSDWRIRIWRDANAREDLGAVATTNGVFEREPATAGTSDDFYRLFVAAYCTLDDTFVSGDPRLRGLIVEARTRGLITAEIAVLRKNPAPTVDFETALANLRALAAGPRIAIVAPERSTAINGHVVGVAERQIGDPDGNDWGYTFALLIQTFDLEAGSG